MTISLNSHEQPHVNVEYFATKDDIEKLTEYMFNFSIQMKHLEISQQNLVKTMDELNVNMKDINIRNIKQDTILALVSKVWRISPYIIGLIFILVLSMSETSFDISKFMISFLNKFIR